MMNKRGPRLYIGGGTINLDTLHPILEEIGNPVIQPAPNSHVVELTHENLMVHFILDFLFQSKDIWFGSLGSPLVGYDSWLGRHI